MLHIKKLYYHNTKLFAQLEYKNNTDLPWRFSYPRGKTFRPLKVDFNFAVNQKFFEGIHPQDIFENIDDEFITLEQGEACIILLDLESWMKTVRLELQNLNLTKNPKIWVCVGFSFLTPKFGELHSDFEICEFKISM